MLLTFKQKLLRTIKRHKKKQSLHTAIALVASFCFVIAFSFFTKSTEVVAVSKEKDAVLTATFVGDLMTGRYIKVVTDEYGYDHLFHYVKPYFDASDYVTGNLESPVVTSESAKPKDKDVTFYTEPQAIPALKKAGFDVITLANNHILDYGKSGFNATLKELRKADLDYVGAGRDIEAAKKISYRTVNGIRVATLGFSDVVPAGFAATSKRRGVAKANPDLYMPQVAKAKQNADLVIVHMHWGFEYNSNFDPRQKEIARALADAGADIVIGHHPHVLEPVEVYKNTLIMYSLGNFVFDQGWSRTKESVLVQYKLMKDGKAKVELVPIVISQGQPRPVTGGLDLYRREKIFSQLTTETIYTDGWDQVWTREDNKIVREVNHAHVLKGVKKGGQ